MFDHTSFCEETPAQVIDLATKRLQEIEAFRQASLEAAIKWKCDKYANRWFFKRILSREQAIEKLKIQRDIFGSEYDEIMNHYCPQQMRLKKLQFQATQTQCNTMFLCTEDANLLNATFVYKKGC